MSLKEKEAMIEFVLDLSTFSERFVARLKLLVIIDAWCGCKAIILLCLGVRVRLLT